jgi:tetrapyrrole methylase family protein/MazG family protein
MKNFDELIEIAKMLNGPHGCPWDQKQTFTTLQKYILEEAQEVVQAVEKRDFENLKEELGDLLYVIIFYSQIAEKNKIFTLEEIVQEIKEKLIRRHPHVFGDEKIFDADSVAKRWQEIKALEKKNQK